MNLFEKTRCSRHSHRLTDAPFIFARTKTCLRGISGYSGIPGHIEIRWANDRHHRVAFCRYPLWRLIGSCCASLAESSDLCMYRTLGIRAIVACAICMHLRVHATNLYTDVHIQECIGGKSSA